MFEKIVTASLIGLSILVCLTSPPLAWLWLPEAPGPTPTPVPPTATATPTATVDPLAGVPTVTPQSDGLIIDVRLLPSPGLGELPSTQTPAPAQDNPDRSLSLPSSD